jgi:hypothetical protein
MAGSSQVKPGQDESAEPISFRLPPQDFPRTALRFAGTTTWSVRKTFLPTFFAGVTGFLM